MSRINSVLDIVMEKSFELWREGEIICLIRRNSGNLCGYCGVSSESPYYKNDSFDLCAHGGITYNCSTVPGISPDIFPGIYWFGFDTSHCGDMLVFSLTMGNGSFFGSKDFGSYRDFEYVKKQTKRLAKQLQSNNEENNNV